MEITGSNPVCATIKGVEAQNRVHGNVAHSSSGLGHHPLKVEITGSNPVCATNTTGEHGRPRNADAWRVRLAA